MRAVLRGFVTRVHSSLQNKKKKMVGEPHKIRDMAHEGGGGAEQYCH